MDEAEVYAKLWIDFGDGLRKHIKYVKLHHKGDLFGDDDNMLWHYTRLSSLHSIVINRQLWLSDLTNGNDEDEVRFGLRCVPSTVTEVSGRWSNRRHADLVARLADETIASVGNGLSVFGFCLSDVRDTMQHWAVYGGGLLDRPAADGPAVAVGFDAQALAYPLNLTEDCPPIYLFNVVTGTDAAEHLAQYWAIKARKALEVLDAPRVPLSQDRVHVLLKKMLVFVCALVKGEGWCDEHEFRLLYVPDDPFEDSPQENAPRPDGRGRYMPLRWDPERVPITKLIPHPLADFESVSVKVKSMPLRKPLEVIRSKIRPRAFTGES